MDEAADGTEAVDKVLTSNPSTYDVVLMDMRMPKMSGDEAAQIIHAADREDLQQLPIIALTADAFEEGRKRSHRAGMVAHITKPFKRKELLDLLARFT